MGRLTLQGTGPGASIIKELQEGEPVVLVEEKRERADWVCLL